MPRAHGLGIARQAVLPDELGAADAQAAPLLAGVVALLAGEGGTLPAAVEAFAEAAQALVARPVAAARAASLAALAGVGAESAHEAAVTDRAGMVVAGKLWVDSSLTVMGAATFNGGKVGYVVEIAQNDDSVSLEAGDVVVISGAGSPVVGEIPVIKVRRAMAGGTSAVVGVVDKHYVLTPKTATPDGRAESAFNDAAIAPGEYLSVVTLGAYKTIKVDATYEAIAPGDLLVVSPNPGHAMRTVSPQPGTTVGKALGELPDGTGVIPVIITLQ
ncbi:MAG: hypothetical protein JSV36_01195 [Anaerolineae bacterium]|nr:MAG: hypothetical protein JSV36_01195 [Anaerolineae bacterium]